jgi:hypothetical protein
MDTNSVEVTFSKADISTLHKHLWITGVALVIKFSVVFVYLINIGFIYSSWILSSFVLINYLKWYGVEQIKANGFHIMSLNGALLLTMWVTYDKLPWELTGNIIIEYVIQVSCISLSIGYLCLQKPYMIFIQICLLFYPLSRSLRVDINVFIVFFVCFWYISLIIDFSLKLPYSIPQYFMTAIPLLRTYTSLFMIYFIIIIGYRVFQLYFVYKDEELEGVVAPLTDEMDNDDRGEDIEGGGGN